MLKLLII